MLGHDHALTTAQLADSLNLSRSVVSHYLEKKIQKNCWATSKMD